MTANQEEALYDFLDDTTEPFHLDDVVSYVRKVDLKRVIHLPAELEAFINIRNLAFFMGNKRWISRRGLFQPLTFVISITSLSPGNLFVLLAI